MFLVCLSWVFSLLLNSFCLEAAPGDVSANCSSFTYGNGFFYLLENIPLTFDVFLLDQSYEDPSCVADFTICEIGSCAPCKPITVDYSAHILLSPRNVDGAVSELLRNTNCTVGAQRADKPGYYVGMCVGANNLVGYGNAYSLVMTVMDLTNTTVLLTKQAYFGFQPGNPVAQNSWADWGTPPVGINDQNELRVWLRDAMNNTITSSNGNVAPANSTAVVVQVMEGNAAGATKPAALAVPPNPQYCVGWGYYSALIAPLYAGDYVAIITANSTPIINSPLAFTAGVGHGILSLDTIEANSSIRRAVLRKNYFVLHLFISTIWILWHKL